MKDEEYIQKMYKTTYEFCTGCIEKCISYELEKRFSDDELIDALKNIH